MTTSNGHTSEIVEGVVERRNEHGVFVDGDWRNASRFRPVELPDRGARVRLELDAKGFIKTLEVLSQPTAQPSEDASERGRRITRLAVLKAAASFAAARETIKSADVLTIADRWLEWVERTD